MPDTTIPIKPERNYTWEQWLAGREKRRRLGNLVAPGIIRRSSGNSDRHLRAAFNGERGPPFGKPFAQGPGSEAECPKPERCISAEASLSKEQPPPGCGG